VRWTVTLCTIWTSLLSLRILPLIAILHTEGSSPCLSCPFIRSDQEIHQLRLKRHGPSTKFRRRSIAVDGARRASEAAAAAASPSPSLASRSSISEAPALKSGASLLSVEEEPTPPRAAKPITGAGEEGEEGSDKLIGEEEAVVPVDLANIMTEESNAILLGTA
jgi:hypothetical protein